MYMVHKHIFWPLGNEATFQLNKQQKSGWGQETRLGHVRCVLTDFDGDVLISRPLSPLLLLTVKTQARWWERTAVSSDERKLQEERKRGCKLTIPERNQTLFCYCVCYTSSVGGRIGRRRKKQQGERKEWEKEEGRDRELEEREEKEKERGNEKGEREEVGRRGGKRVCVHSKLYSQFCFLGV